MAMYYQHAVCSCARMEEESILEWISYHQSIGVDHFFIYGNDDDYRTLGDVLAPLIALKLVTFVHCPVVGGQTAMYLHFINHYLDRCEWFIFLDQDEYIRLDGFDNRIDVLTRAACHFDSVQLNWICYGTSGFEQRPRGSVLRQYRKRAEVVDCHTKHLTRSHIYRRELFGKIDNALWNDFPFWHALPSVSIKTCSTLLEPVTAIYRYSDGRKKTEYEAYVSANSERLLASATIAHFFLRSRADFERRLRRGTQRNFAGQAIYRMSADDQERSMAQGNAVEDAYLAHYWERCVQSYASSAPVQWKTPSIPAR